MQMLCSHKKVFTHTSGFIRNKCDLRMFAHSFVTGDADLTAQVTNQGIEDNHQSKIYTGINYNWKTILKNPNRNFAHCHDALKLEEKLSFDPFGLRQVFKTLQLENHTPEQAWKTNKTAIKNAFLLGSTGFFSSLFLESPVSSSVNCCIVCCPHPLRCMYLKILFYYQNIIREYCDNVLFFCSFLKAFLDVFGHPHLKKFQWSCILEF